MNWSSAAEFLKELLSMIGGVSVVIAAFAAFVSKICTERILKGESHKYSLEIEKVKHELELLKVRSDKVFNDKLMIYREVVELVARVLAAFDAIQEGKVSIEKSGDVFSKFNEERLRIYGFLGMLAPQEIMDAQDRLVDYLLEVVEGSAYEWDVVRRKSLDLINAVRRDLGFSDVPIQYRGER